MTRVCWMRSILPAFVVGMLALTLAGCSGPKLKTVPEQADATKGEVSRESILNEDTGQTVSRTILYKDGRKLELSYRGNGSVELEKEYITVNGNYSLKRRTALDGSGSKKLWEELYHTDGKLHIKKDWTALSGNGMRGTEYFRDGAYVVTDIWPDRRSEATLYKPVSGGHRKAWKLSKNQQGQTTASEVWTEKGDKLLDRVIGPNNVSVVRYVPGAAFGQEWVKENGRYRLASVQERKNTDGRPGRQWLMSPDGQSIDQVRFFHPDGSYKDGISLNFDGTVKDFLTLDRQSGAVLARRAARPNERDPRSTIDPALLRDVPREIDPATTR